jgi:hypothetical protein
MPGSRAVHFVSLACAGSWALLAAMQYQMIPFASYAWGFNFWQYLPRWLPPLFGVTSLALCSGTVRNAIVRGAARLQSRGIAAPGLPSKAAALLLVCSAFWLLRERQIFGDSGILLWTSPSWDAFHIPEIGATLLLGSTSQLGRSLALDLDGVIEVVRFTVCVAGALALLLIWQAARYLTPGSALGGVLLLVSGGLLRIFAGHFEVYAFVLAAVGAYLWASLAYLCGRGPWLAPCLTLGIAIWMHFSAVCLIPSLLLLPRLSAQVGSARQEAGRILTGLALATSPTIVFLLVFWMLGDGAVLEKQWGVVSEILGTSDDPHALNRWVRGWGGEPSRGTDYVFLSVPHLKYLGNAAHVLAPGVLPVLLWLAWRNPRGFRATAVSRFLLAASLPLLVYALALRPIWGPFDWDLFAVTALFLGALSAHLLRGALRDPTYAQVVVWIVGFSLLFVGIPFLLMGVATPGEAGPFAVGEFDFHSIEPTSASFESLEPWL